MLNPNSRNNPLLPLLLVISVPSLKPSKRSRLQAESSAEAVLISPIRSVEFDLKNWVAWVPGINMPIECVYSKKNFAFYDSIDEEGKWIGFVGESPDKIYYSPSYIRRLAACRIQLSLSKTANSIATPFFLGPQNSELLMIQSGKVIMSMQHLDEPADVQANVAFYMHADPANTNADIFLSLANRITVGTGDYLPVSVIEEERTIAGCMRLHARKRWAWGWRKPPIYQADFYWSDQVRHLEPGTILFRKVVWQENGVEKEIQTEVARIISLD